MMKLAAAAFGATLLLAAAPAFAADQDFSLVNRTGYTIDQVYVSNAATDDWEEDVLGEDTLVNGDHVDISFPKRENACRYDLKVVYDDKEEAIWKGFDLCTISTIEIRYNRTTGATSAVTK